MKFVILVEGATEYKTVGEFLKRWLDERLPKPVGIKPDKVKSIDDLTERARFYLDVEDAEIISVIGLQDLYGLKLQIPDKYCESPDSSIKWATEYIEKAVNHRDFRMFFAVHEFEAWLLSQPEIFHNPTIAKALKKKTAPESVDFDKPPAKLLNDLYLLHEKTGYQKNIDGANLFLRLNPEVAYQKCPNLKKMLDTMLEMAKEALK